MHAVSDGASDIPAGNSPASVIDDPPFPAMAGLGTVARPTAWRFLIPPAIAVFILFTFLPALESSYVHRDDYELLRKTVEYKELTWSNVRWMFSTTYAGHFLPLTWLSFALDGAIWQGSTFGFHLTNVVLHCLTAIAFYFVGRRLLAEPSTAGHEMRSAPIVVAAWLAAMLFALHPLRAESVAWLAERGDVLGGLLYVLAIWAYLRYVASSRAGALDRGNRHQLGWYMCVLACSVLSLLAQATAVTLPVVMLVLDAYPLRRLSGRGMTDGESRRRVWLEKLPLVALAWLGGRAAIAAQQEAGAFYPLSEHGLVERLAQAVYGLSFYISKTLYPVNLGPLYELPERAASFGPMFWQGLMVLLPLLLLSIFLRKKWPGPIAAMAVYVVILTPVLGILQSGPQVVADRYSYLSCMGFTLVCTGGFMHLFRQPLVARMQHGRALMVLASVVPLVAMPVLTQRQVEFWRNDLSLWKRGVLISPNSAIANVNYADAIARSAFDLGAYNRAIGHYRRGLEINPADAVAWHHLGDVYRMTGRPTDAMRCYVRALAIDPNRRDACFRLARLFRTEGHPRESVAVLRDGISRHPRDVELLTNLADLLSTHPDRAIRNGADAVKLALIASRQSDHMNPRTLITLATAFAEAQRYEDAVDAAQRAVDRAESMEALAMLRSLRERLALFQAGSPVRNEN